MIIQYIHKLIDNIPKRECPLHLNLILGGGAFNGSYILGALHFLKELERKNYVIVDKISTCSISSILGMMYFTDQLEQATELYSSIIQEMKIRGNLSKIFELKQIIHIDENAYTLFQNRLYICYNQVSPICQKRIVSKYKDMNHVFRVITRSCFIPLAIDYNITYRGKYIDGVNPYFFSPVDASDSKTIFMNVCTLDKLPYMVNLKNERNNYYRLLEGVLDIHKFFSKQGNTTMCSDVSTWTWSYKWTYYLHILVELIIVRVVYVICKIHQWELIPWIVKSFLTTIY